MDTAMGKRKEIIDDYLKQPGYKIGEDGKIRHISKEASIQIDEFLVDKKKIERKGRRLYYKDEIII